MLVLDQTLLVLYIPYHAITGSKVSGFGEFPDFFSSDCMCLLSVVPGKAVSKRHVSWERRLDGNIGRSA